MRDTKGYFTLHYYPVQVFL